MVKILSSLLAEHALVPDSQVLNEGFNLFVVVFPHFQGHSEIDDNWLGEADIVQLLVWILLQHVLILLLTGCVDLVAGHAEFGEVCLRLERALVRGRVSDAQTEHHIPHILFQVKDALEIAFKFEEVVLAQVEPFLVLSECLLEHGLQTADNLIESLSVYLLVDITVGILTVQNSLDH